MQAEDELLFLKLLCPRTWRFQVTGPAPACSAWQGDRIKVVMCISTLSRKGNKKAGNEKIQSSRCKIMRFDVTGHPRDRQMRVHARLLLPCMASKEDFYRTLLKQLAITCNQVIYYSIIVPELSTVCNVRLACHGKICSPLAKCKPFLMHQVHPASLLLHTNTFQAVSQMQLQDDAVLRY